MAPPAFNDIGKQAKDLLGKDYPISGTKLEVKTTAPNGVQFRAGGIQSEKGAIFGDIEGKYTDKPSGVTLSQGWTTSNLLATKVEVDEKIAKGVKTDLKFDYNPDSKARAAKLGLYFKQPLFNTTAAVDLLKTTFVGDVSFGHDGFLAGGEVGYDVNDGKITKYSAAVGYTQAEYSASVLASANFNIFTASYFHRVSPIVEAGGKASWDAKGSSGGVGLEIGTKYIIDRDTFVKGKINNAGIAQVSYSQLLRPGVRVGFGTQIDTKRVNEAAHKFGFDFQFQA